MGNGEEASRDCDGGTTGRADGRRGRVAGRIARMGDWAEHSGGWAGSDVDNGSDYRSNPMRAQPWPVSYRLKK